MYRYELKMINAAKRWKDYPEWIVYGGMDASRTFSECYCRESYSHLWGSLWNANIINKGRFADDEYNYRLQRLIDEGKTYDEAKRALENVEWDDMATPDDYDEEDYMDAIIHYQTNYHFSLMTVQEVLDKYGIEDDD